MSAQCSKLEVERSVVGGRYRLLERIGAGGMAAVYRARDERLRREVAVKLIAQRLTQDASFVRCFRREARLWAHLRHPNIVAVLDAGVEPRDFIVMELVQGVDARSLLRRQARLTRAESVHVVAQVSEALAYAHDAGVLHGDVSPANILLRPCDGTAKLADFGLACRADEAPVPHADDFLGTPGYVAPEVLAGARPTPVSDLYSLGAVTYRLLAGPLAGGVDDASATDPLVTAVPRVPPLAEVRPDLPSGFTRAVERAMALAPDARQRSVADFRAQLIEAVDAPVPLQRGRARIPAPVRTELARAA